MRAVAMLFFAGSLALSAAGAGQPLSSELLGGSVEAVKVGADKVGADCTGGIRYDDGEFELGLGFNRFIDEGRFASRFILPGAVNRLDAVCVCLTRRRGSTQDAFSGFVEVWGDTGDGPEETRLASFPASFTGVQDIDHGFTFYRVNIPQGFVVNAKRAYIGVGWAPSSGASDLLICGDTSDPARSPAYFEEDGSGWFGVAEAVGPALLGVRVEAGDVAPPDGPWLTTAALPGFRFKVRITSGAQQIAGVQEADCVPETLCVSGAVRGRSEVFVRIIGPRPNGFLWPNIVKFTVSQVEVWIEQLGTGRIRYYKLPAQGPTDTSLPGLVDREAFEP